MKRIISFSFLTVFSIVGFGQINWYVDQALGDESNAGTDPSEAFSSVDQAIESVNPGDTIFIIGSYQNPSYMDDYAYSGDINDPQIWKTENTIKINDLHGEEGSYITFKPYDESTILLGDGANIFRVTNASYLRVEGFNIQGEVDNIPLETALALQFLYRNAGETETLYRVTPGTTDDEVEGMTFPVLENISRPSYTDTRGLYMSKVDHIEILDNHIHHAPGTGLRVADYDYITIKGNEVDNNSRKSYSGTHAVVVTKANSMDVNDDHKIFILGNEVHHNFNEIYSWAPSKAIITPRIDEGKGISLQRNDLASGWDHGRFLVANNICYWNGFSGVHSNTGIRMDFVNNTVYFNSYTNTVFYEEDPAGNNIGISTSSGDDIRIINNIIYIDATWGGFPVSSASTTNLVVLGNLVFGVGGDLNMDSDIADLEEGTITANPEFSDTITFDFGLKPSSAAIDNADALYAPTDDFYGALRDENPDRGAVEYVFISDVGLEEVGTVDASGPFPNPFAEEARIRFEENLSGSYEVIISGTDGRIYFGQEQWIENELILYRGQLEEGIYLVSIIDKATGKMVLNKRFLIQED